MHNNTSNKYIITGGPCSGKSTLIEALRNQGFFCSNEIARKVIQQEMISGKMRVPWLKLAAFSELVYNEMLIELNRISNNKIAFFDRGIVDVVAYLRAGEEDVPEKYYQTLKENPFNRKVFFCPDWEDIYVNDTERKEDFSKATQISDSIFNEYYNLGFQLITLPKVSVEERVKLIIQSL